VLEALHDGGARLSPAAAEWSRFLRDKEAARAERQRTFEESDQTPIHHFRLARALETVASRAGDVTYVGDGGNVVAVAAKVLKVRAPGRWLDPGPLGCLGVGAPFAIAAKLLAPERPVCVVSGDGAFGLNGFDFETAVRFKLPMVVVVGNDAAWGQILIPQRGLFGDDHAVATRLAPVRYDRVVEAFGGKGEHVEDPKDLVPALERAFASGTVYCVDVAIDPEAAAAAGAAGYAV
jgi:acetolactate synthase-1/2/3 large subunit